MEKLKAFITSKKHIKYISLGCICVGILLCIVGLSLADYDIYKLNPETELVLTKKQKEIPLQDIASIEVDTSNVSITVEEGDSDQIVLKYEENEDEPMDIQTTNSILSINNKSKIKLFAFNWMNFTREQGERITLQVPKKYAGDLHISNSYDAVSISNVKGVQEFTVENVQDRINVTNIEAESIHIVNSYGSIVAEQLVSKHEVSIENKQDNIDIKNSKSTSMILKNEYGGFRVDQVSCEKELSVRNKQGDTSLTNIQASDVEGELSYGNLQLETLNVKNGLRFDSNQVDATMKNVTSKKSEIAMTYGNLIMKEWVSDCILIDIEQGDVMSDIKGIEADYHIVSDVENGESNLAKQRNEGKSKELNITANYSDVEVNFTE